MIEWSIVTQKCKDSMKTENGYYIIFQKNRKYIDTIQDLLENVAEIVHTVVLPKKSQKIFLSRGFMVRVGRVIWNDNIFCPA